MSNSDGGYANSTNSDDGYANSTNSDDGYANSTNSDDGYAGNQNSPSPYVNKNAATAPGLPSTQIPLDPGVGGQSILPSMLQVGDVIVSTTSEKISQAIRKITGEPVSHAILYVSDGMIIEAVGKGVILHSIDDALSNATVAVAFRYQNLSEQQRFMVRDFAGQQVGLSYNKMGIVRQLLFRLDVLTQCRNMTGEELQSCRNWLGRINLGTGSNDRFFCSELVLAAYVSAGAPLTSTPPNWTSPGEIAELAWTGMLGYVGHLKIS